MVKARLIWRRHTCFWVAHLAQTQARCFPAAGMLSSKRWLKLTWVHQQGACS